ncbi:MAG: DNA-directed RNA polymerase subunit beta', partial [Kiritimatiellae bacterium]|nr:DNA-directed RNA polymerase subunit beta' [Kiritimatiellia bacterium]
MVENTSTNAAQQLLGDESTQSGGFDWASITVASAETVRSWSRGEVKNPETINYRTFKPEKGGLFCERIFGPTKDWECSCGKYKRIKHKGVVCDRCGVEVTVSRVRRERMGHIDLAVPVSHIWFFKCTPSRMGAVLDMTARNLERVLYYEDYVVIDPGENTSLQEKQLLSEMEFREAQDKYGDGFIAKMGAEGVRDLMKRIELEKTIQELDREMAETRSKQTKKKLMKRIKILDAFRRTNTRPEWMILEVLPVIPPDLRPLVPLEGGRFATSDLNDLYRRVINRNNRLRNLLQLKTPDVIIRNEKRMLQEAVDALFDNGRHGRAVTGAGSRPLKSLSDMLRGKQGRFRQNLLGKRVDYSGRSVIVIGPELKLNQCGLPKKMALVLFEPFIIRRLKELGVVHTVRSAKKMIEKEANEVWDILDEVTRGHTVMLNRAPTLHRLSIQSFEPVLIEGEAIRIHPLVCTAYNADFDGDQMAVHVPLSIEAQMESRLLMLAPNNIFSPSSGKPIMTPTQDIALGCYYMTIESQKDRIRRRQTAAKNEVEVEHLPLVGDADEVHTAFDDGAFRVHDRIRYRNPDFGRDTYYGDKTKSVIETTVGRVFFNEIWPASLGFYNGSVPKKKLEELIYRCYQIAGHEETVRCLDRLKALGFEFATMAGVSIGLADMIVPADKKEIVADANKQIADVESQYRKGIITDGERYNKIIDIWTHATDRISGVMFGALEFNEGRHDVNPLYMMVDSGARGNRQQIRQLAGMRGLMAKPSGEIIEKPILSNFREGLSVLEYFISTHGARKGLADTALKTADAGYLTRKLVDVAQDVIIVEQDCNTLNGIEIKPILEGDDELVPLASRILGRTAADDIRDPLTKDVIVAADQEIDEKARDRIDKLGLDSIRIRSVLTCESRGGCCARCYGRNLATSRPVALGESTGIIAAQSIGEPGTQLTMRTFHIGGAASRAAAVDNVQVKTTGTLRFTNLKTVAHSSGHLVAVSRSGELSVMDAHGRERERYKVPYGATIDARDGAAVKAGQVIAKWDPHTHPIVSEVAGVVRFVDFLDGITVQEQIDELTGLASAVVTDPKRRGGSAKDLRPMVRLVDKKGGELRLPGSDIPAQYFLPAGAIVSLQNGVEVGVGDVVARIPQETSKTRDITGGLPRVAELFEARKPKEPAILAERSG